MGRQEGKGGAVVGEEEGEREGEGGFDEERDMRKKVGSDEDVEEKREPRRSSRGKGGSVR